MHIDFIVNVSADADFHHNADALQMQIRIFGNSIVPSCLCDRALIKVRTWRYLGMLVEVTEATHVSRNNS